MSAIEARILRQLRDGGKTFWELIREQGDHLPLFIAALKGLLERGKISFEEGEGRFFLSQQETSSPALTADLPLPACGSCKGKGFVLTEPFNQALERFERIVVDRPLPIARYDQGTILPIDLARKAAFMCQRGDLEGRDILLLGDDDLFSLYLALLGSTGRLLVLDIDTRLLEYLSQKASQQGLSIELREYDAEKELPTDLVGAFQVFVSEPPESLRGLKVFLDRGITSLGEGGVGYFGLTTLESSWSKWLEIQRYLLSRQMVITDILRDFSWYPEQKNYWEQFYQHYNLLRALPVNVGRPNVDWYRSHLIRIISTTQMSLSEEDLYMDEETWATPQPFSPGPSSSR